MMLRQAERSDGMTHEKPDFNAVAIDAESHLHYGKSFEDYGHTNGGIAWYARDLAIFLGYQSYDAFHNAVNRAIASCMTLNISVIGDFTPIEREIEGRKVHDYKLSRFACYLTTMN
jgi:DNA-damage-inducible protein D